MSDEPCCGQPVSRRRRRAPPDPLPANPRVKDGVTLLFVGSGKREVRGPASGLTYVVAEHRRRFEADAGDVDQLLRSRDFMLQI